MTQLKATLVNLPSSLAEQIRQNGGLLHLGSTTMSDRVPAKRKQRSGEKRPHQQQNDNSQLDEVIAVIFDR
ncbi:TPA: hypothetical protein P2R06_004029 [Aeromonas veronii]|nr:hypothetical protein [Aeromonas veronii]